MVAQARRQQSNQADSAQLWQVGAFGGLELLRASFGAFHFAPHAHDEFMIVVTEGGAALPRLWGRAQPVGVDDLFVLAPGEIHDGGPAAGSVWCYRSFYPPAALMRRAAQELAGEDRGIPQFPERLIADPATATMLRRAHLTLESPDSALATESRLLAALVRLVARHAIGKPAAQRLGREHRAVRLAREYLEALPGENVSLEVLAREAGIGPYHLCRVFRRETGLSPHAYQVQARVRRAKALLTEGIAIAQVAAESGFSDQAHLTRHFKRMLGVTPGRYLGRDHPPAPAPP